MNIDEGTNIRSTPTRDAREWRKDKICTLRAQGFSNREIATLTKLGKSQVNRIILAERANSRENMKHFDERMTDLWEDCVVGVTAILREAWKIHMTTTDNKEKISSLQLANDCYSKLEHLGTNTETIAKACDFIREHANKQQVSELVEESQELQQEIES